MSKDQKQRFQPGDLISVTGSYGRESRDLLITEVWHNTDKGEIAYTCREILPQEIIRDSQITLREYTKPEVNHVEISEVHGDSTGASSL